MTRLAMIFGLVVLFGLGYAGIERIGLADARIHSVRAARANAHLAAIIGELEWASTLEQLRGIAQSAADDLGRKWPAGSDLDADQLRAQLEAVLDRAGGSGSAAVFGADRRRVASVAPKGGAEIDGGTRAVEDARAGALTAQLVGGATAPSIVAAAPIGGGRVIAVSVPFDRKLISPWVQAEGPAGDLAVVGVTGELIATTVDGGVPARIPRGTFNLDIGGKSHAASTRPLNDDAGTVGAFVGVSPYDVVLIEAVVKRLRLVYGALAGVAIVLAVFATFFVGPRKTLAAARAEDAAATPGPRPTSARDVAGVPPLPDDSWGGLAAESSSVSGARNVTADHLMAAARVLDGSGVLPAVRHGETLGQPAGASAPPNGLPPLRYSAAPPDAPITGASMPGAPPRGPADRASWGPGTPVNPLTGRGGVQVPHGAAPGGQATGSSVPPITFGRGMSPAPPAVATGAAPYPGPQGGRGGTPTAPFAGAAPAPAGYSATGTYAGYTPLPVVEEDPDYLAAQARLSGTPAPALDDYGRGRAPNRSTSSEIPAPSTQAPRAFDEDHYRGAFDEFVGSKRRLGEATESINFEGFKAKLRKIEQTLIEKHGCRAVRFQVVVRDRQVSLRPQLVR